MTHEQIEKILKEKLDWNISGKAFENLVLEKAGIDGVEQGEGFTVSILVQPPNYYITVEYSNFDKEIRDGMWECDFEITGIWGFRS